MELEPETVAFRVAGTQIALADIEDADEASVSTFFTQRHSNILRCFAGKFIVPTYYDNPE